jgi:hypothetical protein
MPGNDLVVVINQNGIAKSKTRHAVGDLLDLFPAVGPRISPMRHKPIHGHDFDLALGALQKAALHRISASRAGALSALPAGSILIVLKFHFPNLKLAAGTIPTD